MIKHVILWNLKDELTDNEKTKIINEMKDALENLNGKIPGLINISLNTNKLETSNRDIMLDSTFESEEALKAYAIHPEHVKVADEKVRPYVKDKSCFDYICD